MQQTAYDVDNVVQQLKEVTSEYNCIANEFQRGATSGASWMKKRAIEIVKQGGVADDVCEWRIVDRPHNLPIYNTSCGKIRLQYTTGVDIYCNGCGNKIKVKQNDN